MPIRTNGEIERDNKIISALNRIADGIEKGIKLDEAAVNCLSSICTRLDAIECRIEQIEKKAKEKE